MIKDFEQYAPYFAFLTGTLQGVQLLLSIGIIIMLYRFDKRLNAIEKEVKNRINAQ